MKPACFFALTALLLGLGVHLQSGAQQLYRWVDENGRVQYSDRPPPAGTRAEKELKRKPGAQPPAAASSEPQAPKSYAEQEAEFRKRQVEKSEQEAKQRQEQQAAAERKRQCDDARSYLASLQSGSRVAQYNAQGEREYLDDKARAQEIARAQKSIAAVCK
jgi:hypothetical protein